MPSPSEDNDPGEVQVSLLQSSTQGIESLLCTEPGHDSVLDAFIEDQCNHPELQEFIAFLENAELTNELEKACKVARHCPSFVAVDDVLYFCKQARLSEMCSNAKSNSEETSLRRAREDDNKIVLLNT